MEERVAPACNAGVRTQKQLCRVGVKISAENTAAVACLSTRAISHTLNDTRYGATTFKVGAACVYHIRARLATLSDLALAKASHVCALRFRRIVLKTLSNTRIVTITLDSTNMRLTAVLGFKTK